MAISRLALVDVRSWHDLVLEPGPGLVILTGENGAGKTNILEAVSLLAPGRGLRGAALGEVARSDGPGGFAVAARLADGTELGVGTNPASPERRHVRINGASASATALAERVAILWLTPAMDRLFTEGAGGRRRFLDRLVLALEPAHAGHASRYEAAMRARNRLLAEPGPRDDAWLRALEAAMAEHGSEVATARARTVAALAAQLARQSPDFLAAPTVSVTEWAADGATALEAALRDGRSRDAQAGRALAGPHRSDFAVRHRAKEQPAERCSTGEQKALLLSIVLAHADLTAASVDRRPILLLDEVAAHLDPERRAALLARLAAAGGQAWLTGTEPGLFEGVPPGASRTSFAIGEPIAARHDRRSGGEDGPRAASP